MWAALCGTDSVETGSPLLPVHPSGQQILSALTSSVKAASVMTAKNRNTR